MNRNDWETIQEIFNAAVELPRSQRDAYVRAASQGDPQLYSDVDSLLKTDDLAEGFLEPIFGPFSPTPSPIHPGDMLSRRFRIQRLIGEGGMGHVFEAWDTELGRPVALKTIRPEIAQQPEALRRFRREVSLALILTHPSICRTFDIARDTLLLDQARGGPIELHYLTMEFLHGETLAARIARDGALPLDEAQQLALQIGEALTCAHTQGIYHRDIKPANVMLATSSAAGSSPSLTRAPRAVLTDFGLARQEALFRTDDFSAFSQSGLPIGTLSYMAPEQIEGKPATAATDIYAFGLILFEMVTGKRVFPSGNTEINLAQRLTTTAPSPRTHVPNLPEQWCQAIEGCLRLDPTTRYQSATEVLTVLNGGHISLPTIRSLRSLHSQRLVRHNQPPRGFDVSEWSHKLKLTVALLSLLLMSLFAWSLRLYMQKGNAAVDPGALVYMTQIKNETGEKSFDNLSELMQAGLTQSAHINLLDQGRVGDILQQMTKPPDTVITEPIAREIALRAGARRVGFATVTSHNGTYYLNIDIQKPDYNPARFFNHWANTFSWQATNPTASTDPGAIPAELLTTIRTGTNWIRKQVGESANDIAQLDTPPEDVTTSSWEALAAYSKAEHLNHERKQEEAIHALQEAIQIDPQFALSYARLADIDISLGRTIEGYRAYEMALQTDFRRRLTRRELDRIRGIYASDMWDYGAAESAFRDYTIYYEHDYMGWFYRGLPLMRLGRYDEAIASLKRAYQLNSNQVFAPFDLAICYILKGDSASAQQWLKVLRELKDSDAVANLEGILAFLAGNLKEAEKQFSFASNSRYATSRVKATIILVRLACERKQYSQAIKLINKGLQEAAEHDDKTASTRFIMDRAQVECELGRVSLCVSDAQEALLNDSSPETLIVASDIIGQLLTIKRSPLSDSLILTLDRVYKQSQISSNNTAYRQAQGRIEIDLLLAKNKWRDAILKGEEVATQDTQFKRRDYLGRAFYLAAQHTVDAGERRDLLRRAQIAFSQTALHPEAIWTQAALYSPGSLTRDLAAYSQISSQLHERTRELDSVQSFLSILQLPKIQSMPLQDGSNINLTVH